MKFIDTLEIDGTKAVSFGYSKNNSTQTIPVNGSNVEVEGVINAEFRGRGVMYCGSFVIFFFDKSDKLISYVVDDIYC